MSTPQPQQHRHPKQQGLIKYVVGGLHVTALIVLSVLILGCNLVKVSFLVDPQEGDYEEDNNSTSPEPNTEFQNQRIGLFRRQDTVTCPGALETQCTTCTAWDDTGKDNFDSPWKLARAMLLLSFLCGLVLTVAVQLLVAVQTSKIVSTVFHMVLISLTLMVLVNKASNAPGDIWYVHNEFEGVYELEVVDTEIGPHFYLPIVAAGLWTIAAIVGCVGLPHGASQNPEASSSTSFSPNPPVFVDSEQALAPTGTIPKRKHNLWNISLP
jgi:hypothetical protein